MSNQKTQPKERILLVDDDLNILNGYRRQYSSNFDLWLGHGPQEGLRIIEEQGPFAIVVSDYKMPGMNGVEFFRKVREQAPETIRIMLTGFLETAIADQAVSEEAIFLFLTKPCSKEDMSMTLYAGILERHRRKEGSIPEGGQKFPQPRKTLV